MTIDDVRKIISERVEREGSQRKAASELKVTASFINDVVHRRRDPGEKLLNALGITKIVTYEWTNKTK